MTGRIRATIRASLACVITLTSLLAVAPARSDAAASPIPKQKLQEIAAMIVAGEPLDRITRAWTAVALQHRDADFSRAINDIGRQAKAAVDKIVKDARTRVAGMERTRKQLQAELARARTVAAQLREGRQGLKVQQKRIETTAGRVVLKATGIQLTTPEDVAKYLDEFEAVLSSVGEDAQLANIDLQNALQRQQQNLQLVSEVSRKLHDVAMSIIRKIG